MFSMRFNNVDDHCRRRKLEMRVLNRRIQRTPRRPVDRFAALFTDIWWEELKEQARVIDGYMME